MTQKTQLSVAQRNSPASTQKYASILQKYKIAKRYHAAFVEFVDTGEVTSGDRSLLDLFETRAAYQQAVEKAFALRITHLRTALKALRDL
jgi:hypothetical protein